MKTFYLRDEKKVPVACVASEKGINTSIDWTDAFNTAVEVEVINFSVSTHNPADELNKKLGRHIAISRLLIGKHETLPLTKSIKHDICDYIADPLHAFPKRTQAAAQLWLDKHPITNSNNE